MRNIKAHSYWDSIATLQDALNAKQPLSLTTRMKSDICSMIIASLTDTNFLCAKLLIYGHVEAPSLLNFFFHTAVNTPVMYGLFVNDTDKFCSKFMFNIVPSSLPKFENYFTPSESKKLEFKINLSERVQRIKAVDFHELKTLFPRSYKRNIKTNPYLASSK